MDREVQNSFNQTTSSLLKAVLRYHKIIFHGRTFRGHRTFVSEIPVVDVTFTYNEYWCGKRQEKKEKILLCSAL